MRRRRLLVLFGLVIFMLALSPTVLFNSRTASAQVSSGSASGFTQQSGTTGGELRRYIDISSPWSGGYIHEDLTVIGRASITDSFTMYNLRPGSDADYWLEAYKSFDIGFDVSPDPLPESSPPAAPAAGSSSNKPAAAVAGVSVVAKPEAAVDVRAGFRWFDLF